MTSAPRWIKKAFKILKFKIKKRIEVNYEYPEWGTTDNDFGELHQGTALLFSQWTTSSGHKERVSREGNREEKERSWTMNRRCSVSDIPATTEWIHLDPLGSKWRAYSARVYFQSVLLKFETLKLDVLVREWGIKRKSRTFIYWILLCVSQCGQSVRLY